MPDLLDDLRRYGEALEREVSRSVKVPGVVHLEAHGRRDRPLSRHRRRRSVAVLAVAVVVVVVASSWWVVASDDRPAPDVRIEEPSTSLIPTTSLAVAPTTVVPDAPRSGAWTSHDGGPLSARNGSSVVWAGDRMLVWGGVKPEDRPTYGDGAEFSPSTGRWEMLPAAPIGPRAWHVGVWTGTEMVVWGGGGGATGVDPTSDGAAYDPASRTWRTIAAAPLSGGLQYSGVWTGSEVVVVGADRDGSATAAYDPETDRWRTLPQVVLRTAWSTGVLLEWTGSRVVAVDPNPQLDGAANGVLAAIYDPSSDTWTTTRASGFRSQAHDSAVLDDRVLLVSYGPGAGADVVVLDPETATWEEPVDLPLDGCEGYPVAVGIGRQVAISRCGGQGLYGPEPGRFQSIDSPDLGGWYNSNAVWTGSQLLVWTPGIPPGTLNYPTPSPSSLWAYTP